MPWSPTPSPAPRKHGRGWWVTPPPIVSQMPRSGWHPVVGTIYARARLDTLTAPAEPVVVLAAPAVSGVTAPGAVTGRVSAPATLGILAPAGLTPVLVAWAPTGILAPASVAPRLTATAALQLWGPATLIPVLVAPATTGITAPGSAVEPHDPETTSITTPGTYAYDIPEWATYVDVIAVGGAGGGARGSSGVDLRAGDGGGAGSWTSITLQRGSPELPWATATLTGTVGAGGGGAPGPAIGGASGFPGEDTTCELLLTAAGGGEGLGFGSITGDAAGDHVHNSITYVGGTAQTSSGADGNSPGAGGAGSVSGLLGAGPGGAGAPGAVWLRAYQ